MRQRQRIFLKEWRKERGLSAEKLAASLGVVKSTVTRIEKGERPYNQDLIEQAAEILDCDPMDLLLRDPADPTGIWDIWDRISEQDRERALAVLEQFAKPRIKGAKLG
jgi:transcriptional regulator with XRE-family HTH domain